MMRHAAQTPIETQDAPVAFERRGACPSLSAPMKTGDGLLVRLRPSESGVTPGQLRAIAEAAARFGNGILEVTARGNLQIRGLRTETVGPLNDAISALDLPIASGVAIETPPLCGIDADEIADARPLAARVRAAITAHHPALVLAPKLSITVDGGGRFHLGDIVADIRLSAVGPALWRVSIAGNAHGARQIAVLPEDQIAEAVLRILVALDAMGPAARGRDLDAAALAAGFVSTVAPSIPVRARAPRPAGLHDFGVAGPVLGVGLTFCQTSAADLIAFLDEAEALGAREIRLAPDHGLFVLGLSQEAAVKAQRHAEACGFRVAADDPANAIALCAGARGCASAFFDTHALARILIATVPDLLDGSLDVHLSGCPKGCAHPAPAGLTLTGASLGYGLVVNGSASVSPDATIAAKDISPAAERLSALLRNNKNAGETARSCLARLGVDRVAAAMRQG